MTLHSLIKNLSYSLSWLSALSGRGIRFSRFAALVPGLCPAAARGVNIRSLPPGRGGNRRVHGSYTTRGAGGLEAAAGDGAGTDRPVKGITSSED